MLPDAAPPAPAPTRAEIVRKTTDALRDERFGTGPLAELRRLDPAGHLNQPALHRLLARYVPEDQVRGEDPLRRWALVIHCLALAAPDHLLGHARLGTALYDAGYKEKRFVNLLDASPGELLDRLPRAVRFLANKRSRLHGPQMADLVLVRQDHDPERFDGLRRRIAADYYRAEHKAGQPQTPAAA